METKTKSYKMMKTIQGSRDGLKVETFKKDETYGFDDHLAEQFYHQGVIEETTAGSKSGKADPAREGEAGVPLRTQRIEELVSVARDKYGLDVDSTMTDAQVREAIEKAQADPKNRETKVAGPTETKVIQPRELKDGEMLDDASDEDGHPVKPKAKPAKPHAKLTAKITGKKH